MRIYALISTVEVEESMDLPAALQLTLPVVRTASGELAYLSDQRFQPLANVAIVATPGSGGAEGISRLHPECGRRGVWRPADAAMHLRRLRPDRTISTSIAARPTLP